MTELISDNLVHVTAEIDLPMLSFYKPDSAIVNAFRVTSSGIISQLNERAYRKTLHDSDVELDPAATTAFADSVEDLVAGSDFAFRQLNNHRGGALNHLIYLIRGSVSTDRDADGGLPVERVHYDNPHTRKTDMYDLFFAPFDRPGPVVDLDKRVLNGLVRHTFGHRVANVSQKIAHRILPDMSISQTYQLGNALYAIKSASTPHHRPELSKQDADNGLLFRDWVTTNG